MPGVSEQMTEARDAKDAGDPDLEDCQIRQQMKIQGGVEAKYLSIAAVRHDGIVVGTCRVEVWDKKSWQVCSYDLLDDRNEPTGAKLRLRIPEEPLLALKMQVAS